MKQLLFDPKKTTLISVISLIVLSFSFLISLLSMFGVYYIPTFAGWWPLGITFIVLFMIAFIITFVISIIAFKNRNNIVIKKETANNEEVNIKNENEEIQIQVND